MVLKCIEVLATRRLLITIPERDSRILLYVDGVTVQVVSDKCKHRGGPIHLCYLDENQERRCPWHDRKIGKQERSDEICAVYLRGKGCFKLVNSDKEIEVWPVKIVL